MRPFVGSFRFLAPSICGCLGVILAVAMGGESSAQGEVPATRAKAGAAQARRRPPAAQAKKVVPGRLIVKFKTRGADRLAISAQRLLEPPPPGEQPQAELAPYASLLELSRGSKLKGVRPVFAHRKGASPAEAAGAHDESVEAIRKRFPARSRRAPGGPPRPAPDLAGYYALEFDPSVDLAEVRRRYLQSSFVESVEFDTYAKIHHTPNDPLFASTGSWGQVEADLWGLKKMGMESAWDLAKGDGVVVAVVDTGLDYNHPDIAANVWTNPKEIAGNGVDDDGNGFVDDVRGWDFVNGDNDPMDDSGVGHGTHTSGTIAAVGDNGIGIVGVAPAAKIMAVKGISKGGSVEFSVVAPALLYAINNGADVINCSWGPGDTGAIPTAVEEVIRLGYSLGVVIVFAAGNDHGLVDQESPANMREVIAVTATRPDDSYADFSNWGTAIDVAAPGGSPDNGPGGPKPGDSILSLRASSVPDGSVIVGGRYLRLKGTSMACPHVAGLAALVLGKQPNFTNEDVRQAIRASADDVGAAGFDIHTGTGRVNAAKALAIALPPRLRIDSPFDGTGLLPSDGNVLITGAVTGDRLKHYQMFLSPLDDLSKRTAVGPQVARATEGVLQTWDVQAVKPGSYLLRVVATDLDGRKYEEAVRVCRQDAGIVELTQDAPQQYSVIASETQYVWVEQAPGTDQPYRLVALDAATGRRTLVATIPSDSVQLSAVAASGDRVAYSVHPFSATGPTKGATLFVHDLRSGKIDKAADFPETSYGVAALAIDGDLVAFGDPDTGEVTVYDIASRTTTKFATGETVSQFPGTMSIQGKRVAWTSDRNVFVGDVASGTVTRLTKNDTGNPFPELRWPRIWGDDVVWAEQVNDDLTLFHLNHHDLRGGVQRRFKDSSILPTDLSLDRGRVVWSDARNSNQDVYLFDLKAGTERALTSAISPQIGASLAGDRVAWIKDRAMATGPDISRLTGDVEALDLPHPPGPAAFADAVDLVDQVLAHWTLAPGGTGVAIRFRNLEAGFDGLRAGPSDARKSVTLRIPLRTKAKEAVAVRQVIRGTARLDPGTKATLLIQSPAGVTTVDLSRRVGHEFVAEVQGTIPAGSGYQATLILLLSDEHHRVGRDVRVVIESLDLELAPNAKNPKPSQHDGSGK